MSGTLVLTGGKDPLTDDAGHSSYVRAHGLAARRAGYRPIVLCAGESAAVTETAFGTVVRCATRVRPVRNLMLPALQRDLIPALVRLGLEQPGPLLVHGIAIWSYLGLVAGERLRPRGRRSTTIMSAYTTAPDETRSQLAGVDGEPLAARASYAAQWLWAGAVSARLERAGLTGSAAVYANYDVVRRLIQERYGAGIEVEHAPYATERAFEDLWTGPEPPEAAALEPRDAPLLLTMSSHNGRKGVDVVIEAIARARDRGTPLRACLLGGGRLLEAHRRRIAELGLGRSVAAIGWAADNRPYLAAADLFALPSRAEQSGSMAVLEALQYSLPVVATAVDGIPEDVTDRDSALLVPPGDAEALAAALVRLVDDPGLRDRIAAGGREVYERRFTADAFASALREIYVRHGLEPLD